MEIRFFNLNKPRNSTATVAGYDAVSAPSSALVFECTIKDATDVLNPVITLQTASEPPLSYNWCYIPKFHRCYFVNDFTNRFKTWEVSLSVDVMGTYKNSIGNGSVYVTRASSDYDGRIVDNAYPLMTYRQTQTDLIHLFGDAVEKLSYGCYVVGVVGYNSDGRNLGSVRYYAIPYDHMHSLVQGLLGKVSTDTGFDFSQISEALTRAIVDPLQFVKSCVWLPIPYLLVADTPLPLDDLLFVWDWIIECKNRPIKTSPAIHRFTHTFNLLKHPWTSTRGEYMNTEPYTKVMLSIPPFGNFELDTSIMAGATTADLTCDVDLTTGVGVATLSVSGVEMLRVSSQVGVPIQLSQATTDIIGGVGGFLASTAVSAVSFESANLPGVIGSLTGAIGSAVQAIKPSISSIGGSGSFSDLRGIAGLEYTFYFTVDEDNAHKGRPLCEIRTVNSLSGYILCENVKIPINCTNAEYNDIVSIMQNGFYYE